MAGPRKESLRKNTLGIHREERTLWEERGTRKNCSIKVGGAYGITHMTLTTLNQEETTQKNQGEPENECQENEENQREKGAAFSVVPSKLDFRQRGREDDKTYLPQSTLRRIGVIMGISNNFTIG